MDTELLLRWMSEVGSGSIRDLRDRVAWWARCYNLPASDALTARWLRDMSSLAHCEVDWISGKWAATPPAAALLPGSGGTAVLTGSRRPGINERLEDSGLAVHTVEMTPRDNKSILVPFAIYLQADSIRELIDRLVPAGIKFVGDAACNIASTLTIIAPGAPAAPPPWNAPVEHLSDFDTEVCFEDGLPSNNGLCKITTLGRPAYLYRIGNTWHHTDFATGVLLDRAARGVNVMRWRGEREEGDRLMGTLFIDQGVPLPQLQMRALALCSGLWPQSSARAQTTSYRNVPKDVAQRVAQSVRQTLVVIG